MQRYAGDRISRLFALSRLICFECTQIFSITAVWDTSAYQTSYLAGKQCFWGGTPALRVSSRLHDLHPLSHGDLNGQRAMARVCPLSPQNKGYSWAECRARLTDFLWSWTMTGQSGLLQDQTHYLVILMTLIWFRRMVRVGAGLLHIVRSILYSSVCIWDLKERKTGLIGISSDLWWG